MSPEDHQSPNAAEAPAPRRLFVFNGGFVMQPRLRRILALAGYRVSLGRPGPEDIIGVWGQAGTAHRGHAAAERTGAALLHVEDAWLRSLFPGRAGGSAPLGLLIDRRGLHFDPAQPSDLETLLAQEPLDDTALLDRARGAIARMIDARLTKYTATDPQAPVPDPGYVLVIDQTRGDASVTASRADRNRFLEMLFVAREEHPGAHIVIKSHPETSAGARPGHLTQADARLNASILDTPVCPWALLDGAIAVYTVSSQMGFEAILAGHKPRVFGQPFYAGWGLTADEIPLARRQRRLTRAQLFAGAVLQYPVWYDPFADALCDYETAAELLAAETRAWERDRAGYVASGMRLWKRRALQKTLGRHKPLIFEDNPKRAKAKAQRKSCPQLIWASKAEPPSDWTGAIRLEDGFLRSRGLGAALVPALSLAQDTTGIYYDPSAPSDLEALIIKRARLRPDQRARAEKLIKALNDANLSKYNIGTAPPDLPKGRRILVPGQVEDDASIRTGASETATNAALLEAARAANPDATLIYKPHPDVEAGLRPGAIDSTAADITLTHTDPAALLPKIDAVWTITSLLGFEALLRGCAVTTLGAPFYAGWGLTTDLGPIPPRRRHDVTLPGLVHAALIDYPRYFDPKTGRPCPVETILPHLANGKTTQGPLLKTLAKLQGLAASQAHLWR